MTSLSWWIWKSAKRERHATTTIIKTCSVGMVDLERKVPGNACWNEDDPCSAVAKHEKSVAWNSLRSKRFRNPQFQGKRLGNRTSQVCVCVICYCVLLYRMEYIYIYTYMFSHTIWCVCIYIHIHIYVCIQQAFIIWKCLRDKSWGYKDEWDITGAIHKLSLGLSIQLLAFNTVGFLEHHTIVRI